MLFLISIRLFFLDLPSIFFYYFLHFPFMWKKRVYFLWKKLENKTKNVTRFLSQLCFQSSIKVLGIYIKILFCEVISHLALKWLAGTYVKIGWRPTVWRLSDFWCRYLDFDHLFCFERNVAYKTHLIKTVNISAEYYNSFYQN